MTLLSTQHLSESLAQDTRLKHISLTDINLINFCLVLIADTSNKFTLGLLLNRIKI